MTARPSVILWPWSATALNRNEYIFNHMAGGIVRNVRVAGIASAVPASVDDIGASWRGGRDELAKVMANTGVRERRIATHQTCTSDLCLKAAEVLLADLRWARDSIDLLLFVSQTPDHILPATSCVLHGRLGLAKHCASFDVSLGCSGYVYGLHIASSLLSTGLYSRALLLVGDTISKVVSPDDRSVAYLFGDAGAATALEYLVGAEPMGFELGTDGTGSQHLQIPAGAFRVRSGPETRRAVVHENGNIRSEENLSMNGAEVFNFTLREIPGLLRGVLGHAGWNSAEVDWWVMHQANRFMLEYLGKRMKIPVERNILALEKYGNTSSASIPLAITDSLRLRLAGDPKRLVLAGFGVGFSWAAVGLTLSGAVVPPVAILELGAEIS